MTTLHLRTEGARRARQHPAIAGKDVLARGEFSAVFDNGDTVLKLTCDQYHYMLLNDGVAKCEGPHFPRVIRDYGEIGAAEIYYDGWKERPLYLFEVEKLVGIKAGKQIKTVRTVEATMKGAYDSPSLSSSFWKFAKQAEDLPSIKDAFGQLAQFSYLMGCEFDLKALMDLYSRNFMVRPATGDLVFSDPICYWQQFAS